MSLKNKSPLLALCGLLPLCAIAAAQSQPRPLPSPTELQFLRSELGQERRIKGAPYCAEAVHESVQPLTDGNRIVRSQTSRICRDGEGRTRQEVEREGGRRSIYLRDPVARESWLLDPQARTALKLPGLAANVMPLAAVPPAPPAPPAAPAAPEPPTPVLITENEGGGEGARREVRVRVLREMQPPPPDALPAPQAPRIVALRSLEFAPRGPGSVTMLPAREIEGLKATGERTTWTIEAGRIGNEKPIVISREVWTSPELGLTLASRDLDPRSGESAYRLQNIRRAEPDAALMKVPADYTVQSRTPPRAPRAPSAPDKP